MGSLKIIKYKMAQISYLTLLNKFSFMHLIIPHNAASLFLMYLHIHQLMWNSIIKNDLYDRSVILNFSTKLPISICTGEENSTLWGFGDHGTNLSGLSEKFLQSITFYLKRARQHFLFACFHGKIMFSHENSR